MASFLRRAGDRRRYHAQFSLLQIGQYGRPQRFRSRLIRRCRAIVADIA